MKKLNVLYWIFTALFAAMMLMSAIPDIAMDPVAVQGMHDGLGYPTYFIPFIGVAKLLGSIAILIPGFHRIKEWAFAGLFFDLIGATFSIIAAGGTIAQYGFMILPLALGVLAYAFYHKRKAARVSAPGTTSSSRAVLSSIAS
jgi:uncharacterized membrane protein YphA (DoxX/SURF4 family)